MSGKGRVQCSDVALDTFRTCYSGSSVINKVVRDLAIDRDRIVIIRRRFVVLADQLLVLRGIMPSHCDPHW